MSCFLDAPSRRATSVLLRRRSVARHGFFGLALVALLGVPNPVSAHEFKSGDIEIDHPWSREIPEGARVAAGYLVVKNHGAAADRLVSVSSAISGKAEVHEMAVSAEGVMTMRPISGGVEIPAGGELALKPGAFHIMFMDLKERPQKGTSFQGTLTFEKAGSVEVEFTVESR